MLHIFSNDFLLEKIGTNSSLKMILKLIATTLFPLLFQTYFFTDTNDSELNKRTSEYSYFYQSKLFFYHSNF